MALNYYVWVIRNELRTVVIDTGFGERAARQRNRELLNPVAKGLAMLGVDVDAVEDVVITHMHYDHAGNNELFSKATFHLQDTEMAFATGRCMCHDALRHSYEVDDVVLMVRRLFEGRVCFHDGDVELFPGITLIHIGGHTKGLQAVRVKTRRGYVVIASDVAHHYAHLAQRRVFPVLDSVSAVLEGYDRVDRLAESRNHIIPGHDPLVASIYPPYSEATKGWIVRLDEAPSESPY
ncbi:N-acyl homoserine lactonase family protein [Paenalcaligenes niemegkensis]|uniref:N-acyl homoserine lactonase family protein n=1 Tax=Paenalcaligenes niemegkensis TaxID=2895469 RepID=UPI0027E2EE28|nr:N-acyl homoserine lactonase family protein [Paenalcaligenes niemegkensis]